MFLVFALLPCCVPINSLSCITSLQAFCLGSGELPAAVSFSCIPSNKLVGCLPDSRGMLATMHIKHRHKEQRKAARMQKIRPEDVYIQYFVFLFSAPACRAISVYGIQENQTRSYLKMIWCSPRLSPCTIHVLGNHPPCFFC